MTRASGNERWLCLLFAELPLEVLTRGLDDNEASKAQVVVERGRVCRLNPAANALGVELGSTMNTALTLADSLTCFERDERREQEALARLAQWAYQFTPAVSIAPPDSLLLEISGCLRLFKGEPAMIDRIVSGLSLIGHHPRIGLSRTPASARLAATAGVDPACETVPVDCLDIEPEKVRALEQMGIVSLDALMALPAASLSRRFGTAFTDYLGRLSGAIPDPRQYITPAPAFDSEIVFAADVTNTGALLFPMKRLLGELSGFLDGRQLGATRLTWRLDHRSHAAHEIDLALSGPENDAGIFLSLTQLKLERLTGVDEVDSLRLIASDFVAADRASGDLFDGTPFRSKDGRFGSTADKARAEKLLNMFMARLGASSCFSLSTRSDHRPERSWQRVQPGTRLRAGLPEPTADNPRPLFLLPSPKPLSTLNGRPTYRGPLELLKGPERIDFGWWDLETIDRPHARDYYVARHSSGALYWIFAHPAGTPDARWYLHGIFS